MTDPIPARKHIYPHRKIFSPSDQPHLYTSKWFHSTIGLILRINMVLRGKYAKDITHISPACQLLLDYFTSVSSAVEDYPPVNQPQRFGNISYRLWCDGIREKTLTLCRDLIISSDKYPEGYADLGFNDEIDASITKYRKEATNTPELAYPMTTRPQPEGRKHSPVFRAKVPVKGQDSNDKTIPVNQTVAPGSSFAKKQPSFMSETTDKPSFDTVAPSFMSTTPSQHQPPPQQPSPTASSLSLHNSSGLRPTGYNPPTTVSHPPTGNPTSSFPSQPQVSGFSSFQQRHQIQTDPHITLPCSLAQEFSGLLLDSFGNYVRIDYGTGHELAFLTFIAALYEEDIITDDDLLAITIKVFGQYLALVRKLQKIYWLEPAGSKGAWGLDDYQFLPFLFGTSQLCPFILPPNRSSADVQSRAGSKENSHADAHAPAQTQKQPQPSPHHNQESTSLEASVSTLTANDSNDDHDQLPTVTFDQLFSDHHLQDLFSKHGFLFADALIYLRETKTGYIQIHSPILYSLASVPSCETANNGLLRMYGGEVLSKYPVMQHVKFGSILSFDSVTTDQEISNCEHIRSTIQIAPSALKVNHPNASLDAAIVIRQK